MRHIAIRIVVSLALVAPAIGQVHAGWFSGPSGEQVDQMTPDAAFTVTFINRTTLGLDPSQLHITADYVASKPDEKGVRRETHKDTFCSKGQCWTHKSQVVVERSIMLPSNWISRAGNASMVIRVPEFLSGPGAYRLSKLKFPCLDEDCTRAKFEDRIEVKMEMRTEPVSKMAVFLHVKPGPASNVATVAYEGHELALPASAGSQADSVRLYKDKRSWLQSMQTLRALQDASGTWHISPNALIYSPNEESHHECSGLGISRSDKELAVNASLYPTLAWARRFDDVTHSKVYVYKSDFRRNESGELESVQSHLANWTGCTEIKGEGPEGNEETRYYAFNKGRVIYRRVSSYDGRVSLEEEIELDGNERPLFVDRREYQHRSAKESNVRWSRLVEEALPGQIQDAIPVDVGALMREGEDVKKVIAHSFLSPV